MKKLRIADLFCGAGGTSTGAIEAVSALGYHPELTAVNHWPVAVSTHEQNHPEARHLCASLDSVNPRELFRRGHLDILWASPECTHHSTARGGVPINDQSRATAWCVTRWADALHPDHILVENVPEFRTWGPIGSNGRPLKSRKGATFLAWLESLRSLGYTVDHRVLCSADFGDPTTRTRLFVQAVRGRRKIIWPDATHAEKPEGDLLRAQLLPWVPAREIIDWEIPCPSIFERSRPLKEKTLRRIEAGLQKFGLRKFIVSRFGRGEGEAPRNPHSIDRPCPTVTGSGAGSLVSPFLIPMEHKGRVASVDRPLHTVSTARCGATALVEPFLVELRGGSESQVAGSGRSLDKPSATLTAGGVHLALVDPFLVNVAHGGGDGRRTRGMDAPLETVCGNGEWAMCRPFLLGQQSGGAPRECAKPVPTVCAAGKIAVIQPFILRYNGTGVAEDTARPLPTVTTKDRFALVRPVVEIEGERYLLDIGFRMLQPHELAAAQGFRRDYRFSGKKQEVVKQIGNAVTRRVARALVAAAVSQNPNVSWLTD